MYGKIKRLKKHCKLNFAMKFKRVTNVITNVWEKTCYFKLLELNILLKLFMVLI